MPPWQGGGDMIRAVSFGGTSYNELPYKFEAGTPDVGGAVGLGAACRYLQGLGLDRIHAHESLLLEYAIRRLSEVAGLRLVGTARERSAVVSFVLDGAHPHDVGTIIDAEGVAVRTGHHCAMPLMERLGVTATVRASFGIYNSFEDVDRLVSALARVREVFS
jgi:cysteine desulfurase/selenocysteine lyase